MRKIILKTTLQAISILFLLIGVSACTEDDAPEDITPSISNETTEANAEITYTEIKISGKVESNDNRELSEVGVCWSTNQNPTIENNSTVEQSNAFTSVISDLEEGTTYFFRIYATIDETTTYGEELTFTTEAFGGTFWDFLVIFNDGLSWHADVEFKTDGTTVYDEPEYPGQYLTLGTWTIEEGKLKYDMDAEQVSNTAYQFTGTFDGLTKMSGTFTFGTDPDKSWSATLVEN